jgi:hypothetical protein
LEPRIGKVAESPHRRKFGELPEVSEDSPFIPLRGIEVPFTDINDLLVKVSLNLGTNSDAPTHGFPDRESRSL